MRHALVVTLVLAACGGESGEGSGSNGSTSAAPGTTGGLTASETSANPTDGAEETTAGTGSGATTGGADETGSGATTAGAEDAVAAFYLATALDRVVVRKRNAALDLCTTVGFVFPAEGVALPEFAVGLPEGWGVESAEIHQGTEGCLESFSVFPSQPEAGTGGTGSAAWRWDGGCPPTVDIDVTLTFVQGMPWVPAEELLVAQGIPVQGC